MNWKNICQSIEKRIPGQKDLRNSFLYHIIGDKLFTPHLWKPSRTSVASSLALGVFISLTPTVGAQMIIAGLAAFFLKVNIPVALAACWITNPVTIPFIYPLQYKLGILLFGAPRAHELAMYAGPVKSFIKYAKPLWLGCIVSAVFFSALSYISVFAAWGFIEKKLSKMRGFSLSEDNPL